MLFSGPIAAWSLCDGSVVSSSGDVMRVPTRTGVLFLCAAVLPMDAQLPKDDGYRGIWYFMQLSKDQYGCKYSCQGQSETGVSSDFLARPAEHEFELLAGGRLRPRSSGWRP